MQQHVDFRLHLNTEKVTAAHPEEPICVSPETPLSEVLEQLQGQGTTGSVLICRDEKLLGIFTERDLLRMMANGSKLDESIEKVMIRNPVTVSNNAPVAAAIKKMSDGGYRRLPIVDREERVLGMVTVAGIVRYMVDHFPEAIYNLPPEPNAVVSEREGA